VGVGEELAVDSRRLSRDRGRPPRVWTQGPALSLAGRQAAGRGEQTSMVIPAGRRSKGQFPVCEGDFPSPRKQPCRDESRAAVLCDGSSQAQRPSSSEQG
jgi:hypothetical protein